MVEIPDRLRCVYSGRLERHEESYVFEVPSEELDIGDVEIGETYRVGVFSPTPATSSTADDEQAQQHDGSVDDEQTPPVEEGDVREVTIETLGEQGDGIARIDRGYVVIVPGTRPDDEVTVEIVQVRENVAFAEVRLDEPTRNASASNGEPGPSESLGED